MKPLSLEETWPGSSDWPNTKAAHKREAASSSLCVLTEYGIGIVPLSSAEGIRQQGVAAPDKVLVVPLQLGTQDLLRLRKARRALVQAVGVAAQQHWPVPP